MATQTVLPMVSLLETQCQKKVETSTSSLDGRSHFPLVFENKNTAVYTIISLIMKRCIQALTSIGNKNQIIQAYKDAPPEHRALSQHKSILKNPHSSSFRHTYFIWYNFYGFLTPRPLHAGQMTTPVPWHLLQRLVFTQSPSWSALFALFPGMRDSSLCTACLIEFIRIFSGATMPLPCSRLKANTVVVVLLLEEFLLWGKQKPGFSSHQVH